MRRVVLGLGVVLLVVAAALGVAFVYRLPLAAAGLRYGLARAGFADARFAIERIDAAGATVTGIEAGERLRIDRLDVTFDFHRLPQPPVERVHVAGARLQLPNASGGEGTTQEPAPSSGFPVALLPALELENVIVTIPSTIGPISLRLDSTVERQEDTLRMRLEGALESGAGQAALRGEARLDPGGTVSMSVQIPSLRLRHARLRVGAGSVNARFEGEASGLDVRSANGQIELTLKDVAGGGAVVGDVVATLPITLTRESSGWAAKLADADLRLPAEALHFGAISADGSWQSAELRVNRIEGAAREQRLQPLSLPLKLLEIQPAPRFSADLTAANGRAALHAEGRYDPSSVGAKIDASLPPLAVDPAGLKRTVLSPG